MTRECEPCRPEFPTPRDEYGWDRDGGDDVPGVIRRLPARAPIPYVAPLDADAPERRLGEPGEHAPRSGAC